MTDGPRQAHRLVTEILTVLERHGHHAYDAQHADQAAAMIPDLTGIYDGTRDVPVSTGRHAAQRPYPELHRPDSLVVTGADVDAVFTALELAAEYKRQLIETCAGCEDQSCNVCRVRLEDAEAFDRLADRLLRRRLVPGRVDRSPLEPAVRAIHLARPAPTARKLASDQPLPATSRVPGKPPGRPDSGR